MSGLHTPISADGLRVYDDLPPEEAIRRAWTEPGQHPDWHHRCIKQTRDAMPLLVRAIERLVRDGARP